MAACTFAARLEIEFRLLVPAERITALSRGTSGGTSEVTSRTTAIAGIAAGVWSANIGTPGAYDDTDGTVGNQTAKAWGVRYMMHLYRDAFALADLDVQPASSKDLMAELELYRGMEVANESTPVIYDVDGEEVTE